MTVDLYEQRQMDAWSRHRAERAMQAAYHNLQSLTDGYPVFAATPIHPDYETHTVIVIGAGPGVAEHLDLLREAQGKVYMIAVNAIMPGLVREGIRVDAVLCRESIDQSHHLAHGGYDSAILDISAHERVWAVAREHASVRAFIPASTQFWSAAMALDTRPVYAGTAALTGAIAVAKALGAVRVITVGCDLAVDQGAAYGPLSAYGQVGVVRDGDQAQLTNTGELDRGALAAGVSTQVTRQVVRDVLCWDGVMRPQLSAWVDQQAWLDRVGMFHAGVLYRDLGTKSSVKKGWLQIQRDEMESVIRCGDVDRRPLPHGELVDPSAVRIFLDELKADAEWLASPTPTPRFTTGFIETMAAAGLVLARDVADPQDRLRIVYESLRDAATWVLNERTLFDARSRQRTPTPGPGTG